MQTRNDLKDRVRQMLVENLMLQIKPENITDDMPLFAGGLGLDSVDALQLVVALDKTFGLKIKDPEMAKAVLQSINTIATGLEQHSQASQQGSERFGNKLVE
jgi:acyl carrier protein